MMIISLSTSSTWTRRFQVQREKSSQPKYLVLKIKTIQSLPIYNLLQCVEQECQLALGQMRQAVIQKKTLQL